MAIFATAGTKLFIGTPLSAKNADFVEGDFSKQVWTEITPMESLGSIGDKAADVSFTSVGNRRVQKLKGTLDAGTMSCVAGLDYSDAGQAALHAAFKTPHDYAFKLEFPDKPATGKAPASSKRLFVAQVMSASENLDGADKVMKLNFDLAINSNLVRVNATDGGAA